MAEQVTELLSKPWQKFLAKFEEINNLPVEQWKEAHLLGYFCKRYETLYEQKYALSFKGAPSRCTEIYMIKRTMAMLDTTDPEVVKHYIDWIFDQKIIPNKMRIRTIGFLTTPGFGNVYNQYRSKKEKITKSTELPQQYKAIVDELNVDASTYGDLAFIRMALEKSSNTSSMEPYLVLFNRLKELNFKPETLDSL